MRIPGRLRHSTAPHHRAFPQAGTAIDFVIVIVGVFIGVQVSHWNAAPVDERRV
jgi:hypothetical protein